MVTKSREPEEEEADGEEEDGPVHPKVAKRVEALEKLHDSLDSITNDYKKERIALEAKYQVLKDEVYSQRSAIISGASEPEAAAAGTTSLASCSLS